jgi:hypothetical protein
MSILPTSNLRCGIHNRSNTERLLAYGRCPAKVYHRESKCDKQAVFAAYLCLENVKKNVLPLPISDSTQAVPPFISAIFFFQAEILDDILLGLFKQRAKLIRNIYSVQHTNNSCNTPRITTPFRESISILSKYSIGSLSERVNQQNTTVSGNKTLSEPRINWNWIKISEE